MGLSNFHCWSKRYDHRIAPIPRHLSRRPQAVGAVPTGDVVTKTFRATLGDVLGWDQRECSVLFVAGGEPAIEDLRKERGAVVTVTVEIAEKAGTQRELFER